MSQTQTAKKRGFSKASAQRKPTLVCVGYVASVSDGRESKSGKYNTVTVDIAGLGGAPSIRVYPCSRPEWFTEGFRPDSLTEVEGGDKILRVYQSNIDVISQGDDWKPNTTLKGLAGSSERFDLLAETLLSDPDASSNEGDLSAKAVEKALDTVLVAKQGEEPFPIGYILRQQSQKTDEQDEDGKDIYVFTDRYEVKEFFEATPKELKKYRGIAEKSAAKAKEEDRKPTFLVTYDEGIPF